MFKTHTSGHCYKHKRCITPSSKHICQHCWLVEKAVKINARINCQSCDQILFMTFHENVTPGQINVTLNLTSKLTEKQRRKSGQMTQLYFCTSRCSSRSQLRETKGSAHNLSTRSVELEKRQKILVFHTNREVSLRFLAFYKLFQARLRRKIRIFNQNGLSKS